jgi:pimeloyl-ACP methyl ester carboxylesterase
MPTEIKFCETPALRVAYLEAGPADGRPALLVHGWPDDATTWEQVAPALHDAGWHTYAPWLRGFGATRFRDSRIRRSGEIAAFTQDALDLVDALGIDRFAAIGHDWGARVAAALASTRPERISHCAMLSVPWQPGPLATPPLPQTRAFWHQWFATTRRGEEFVREHGKAFAREMWDTWSPPGWFDDAEFDRVAASFANPDWVEITLHSMRVRWQEAEPDPRYAGLAAAQLAAKTIDVPALMLQGGADTVSLPVSSEGKERYFTASYERRVLPGVGHFLTREAPSQVAASLNELLLRER